MTSTAFEIVRTFEETIANYTGAKYAVAVDSCCNAIFLCCCYIKNIRGNSLVSIPKFTYPGVACAIINAGFHLDFYEDNWSGEYLIRGAATIDSALRFKKGMNKDGFFTCLSFHCKKHIPIGRGGMIITNNEHAYFWFKKARFNGRDEKPLSEDNINMVGWDMYMTPEQAARGLMLFENIKDIDLPDIDCTKQNYPDLSKIKAYGSRI